MAYTLSDFPLSTEEAKIEVSLPVGTYVLELVVEDNAGLKSLPDTVVVTVEKAEVPSASITGIEPLSALQGASLEMTIHGTGLEEATDVIFYAGLDVSLLKPVNRNSFDDIVTKNQDRLELIAPSSRLVSVPDSSIITTITGRRKNGISVRVNIAESSQTGSRTIGVVVPGGTVKSGNITFAVKALLTITTPTVTMPTLTIPTLTVPTLTRPTVVIPTVVRPGAMELDIVKGVGDASKKKLNDSGIITVDDLANASPEVVAKALNFKDVDRAKELIDAAKLIK